MKLAAAYALADFALAGNADPDHVVVDVFDPRVPKAVSYTHLDVYKRQVQKSGSAGQ